MNRPEILRIDQITPAEQAQFGGKAAHLGALARAGLLVPPGFCIASESFRQFVAFNKLEPRIQALLEASRSAGREADSLVELRELIQASPHVPAFANALETAYQRLGLGGRSAIVAVRSSARAEDSSDASYAGQYDSLLNVQGSTDLLNAVRQGWAGYFSDRAIRYRLEHRQHRLDFNMGLVVQEMIDPDVSGVMFTLNPMTGSSSEILIEAGLGLGEAYVSGQVCPDTFYVSRPGRFSFSKRFEVRTSRIEPKSHMLKSTPPGSGLLAMVNVPPDRRQAPALDTTQLSALAAIGLRVERLFNSPQDIEWAIDLRGRIYLLQARPVTTRAPRYRRRSTLLWTQRFSGERWTEPATTLGWSIMQPILHHFIYFEDIAGSYLQGSLPTRVISGYPYFNITIFRHLVWKLPGFAPPQFVLELFPREEQEEMLAAPYIIPNLGLVRTILAQVLRERRWRRYHWNFLTNHRAWDAFLPGFIRAIEALPEQSSDEREARAAVQTGQQLIQDYIKIHLLSLLFANLYYQLLSSGLRRWVGDDSGQLMSDLVAAPGGNKSVETNRALWKLAALARKSPQVEKRLVDRERQPTRLELAQLPGGSEFVAALDGFLAEYGHRSTASWEIFSPRYCDDQGLVLGFVQTHLRDEHHHDPDQVEAERMEARRVAEARIRERLGWGHPLRRAMLEHVLGSTQKYMTLRENQRFYFDRLLLKVKRSLESLGRIWVADGRLSDPLDMTLLTLEEVDEVIQGRLDAAGLHALIETRRQVYESVQETRHPVFLEGDRELIDAPGAGRTLSGLGVSPGRITGLVRVINNLREVDKLRRGDILVARATDPSWSSMFPTAGGLITELGGLLSHGAVVAREYNLPAVVNIAGATSLLKDGQQITLDGSRGVVYLH